MEEVLAPYHPVMALTPTSVISHKHVVDHVRSITAGPSGLESTSVVFAHGLDCFFTLVQSAGGYDILSPNFNYPMLFVSVIVIVGSVVVSGLFVGKKALADKWK